MKSQIKLIAAMMAATLTVTGCQSVNGLFDRKADTVETAEKTDAAYYQEASEALDKNQNRNAI